jgi:hypothetical protein
MRTTYCLIARIHAGRDLAEDAAPCQCEHCRSECSCEPVAAAEGEDENSGPRRGLALSSAWPILSAEPRWSNVMTKKELKAIRSATGLSAARFAALMRMGKQPMPALNEIRRLLTLSFYRT